MTPCCRRLAAAGEYHLRGKGDYLKLQEGDNRIQLMSECLEHPGEYLGTPTFKSRWPTGRLTH
jgi:hypothetical protein